MKKAALKDILVESGLWVLSNALCVAFPVSALYVILYVFLGMSLVKVTALMSVAAVVTATWGSWSSQIWTRNRVLRSAMRVVSLLPGIFLMVVAGFGVYLNFSSVLIWIGLFATGAATIALAWMLGSRLARGRADSAYVGRATGILLFPLGATGMAGVVGYLWFNFFASRAELLDWGWLFNLSTYAVTTLAFVLVSTVVPASMSLLSRRLVAPSD